MYSVNTVYVNPNLPIHPPPHLPPLGFSISVSLEKFVFINFVLTFNCCCSLVTKSRLTLLWPQGLQPASSSVHGISQARILAWVTISFFRGSSQPRDRTCISCLAGGFFATEPLGKPFPLKLLATHVTLRNGPGKTSGGLVFLAYLAWLWWDS